MTNRFKSTVIVRAICIAATNFKDYPTKLKVYKNEDKVDFSIAQRKPI